MEHNLYDLTISHQVVVVDKVLVDVNLLESLSVHKVCAQVILISELVRTTLNAYLLNLLAYRRESLLENYDLMADGQIVEVMFHTEKETVLSAELPPVLDMEVTYTEPGIKGDTASTNSLKPATVNTGATVRVPLFVNTGDKIRVDSRTREYKERIR